MAMVDILWRGGMYDLLGGVKVPQREGGKY